MTSPERSIHSERAEGTERTTNSERIAALQTVLSFLKETVGEVGIPGVKPAIGGLLSILDVVQVRCYLYHEDHIAILIWLQTSMDNKESISSLTQRLEDLRTTFNDIIQRGPPPPLMQERMKRLFK